MKLITRVLSLIGIPALLLLLLLFLSDCGPDEKCDLRFKGKVVDRADNNLAEVLITIGEKEVKTDKEGRFEICVNKSGRYVLSASKLNFGFYSKSYADTVGNLVIKLAKATVQTFPGNTDITVQDVRPDMSDPGRGLGSFSNPLDTVPFVYNSKGELIGFTKPQSLIDAEKAATNFEPPVLGARIEIPRGSLIYKKSKKQFEGGEVKVSLNTIDIYSAGDMPGNNTIDFGNDSLGYMLTYGAANIEAYGGGEELTLGPDRTATLTIPVDTMSIITKKQIPNQIPLLTYNRSTGYWTTDGNADLNAAGTAYVAKIHHFSTYNMDLEKINPSCIQLCTNLGTTSSLTVLPDPSTLLPNRVNINNTAFPSCTGTTTTTRCAVYSIMNQNVTGLVNITNNALVDVKVMNGATTNATYVLNSGSRPAGMPNVYQQCPYQTCAGPFLIQDQIPCWEKRDAANVNPIGLTKAPILAVEKMGTNTIKFTILHFEKFDAATGDIKNAMFFYKIQFLNGTAATAYSDGDAAWKDVDLSSGTGLDNEFSSTATMITKTTNFDGTAAYQNQAMSTTMFFRVVHSTTTTTGYPASAPTYALDLDPFDPMPVSFTCKIN